MPPTTPEQRLEKRLAERMVKAMATFKLIEDGDRIEIVSGLSGGEQIIIN